MSDYNDKVMNIHIFNADGNLYISKKSDDEEISCRLRLGESQQRFILKLLEEKYGTKTSVPQLVWKEQPDRSHRCSIGLCNDVCITYVVSQYHSCFVWKAEVYGRQDARGCEPTMEAAKRACQDHYNEIIRKLTKVVK
ncbi:MAG: hypothetical protein ACPGXY_03185 [Alphaproteobacteria bacterium]